LCEGYFPEDFELENNESAVGLNLLSFSGHEGEWGIYFDYRNSERFDFPAKIILRLLFICF